MIQLSGAQSMTFMSLVPFIIKQNNRLDSQSCNLINHYNYMNFNRILRKHNTVYFVEVLI